MLFLQLVVHGVFVVRLLTALIVLGARGWRYGIG